MKWCVALRTAYPRPGCGVGSFPRSGGPGRLSLVRAISGLGAWVLAGIADSPSLGALALFAPGQLAWLLVDLLRRLLRQRRTGKSPHRAPCARFAWTPR